MISIIITRSVGSAIRRAISLLSEFSLTITTINFRGVFIFSLARSPTKFIRANNLANAKLVFNREDLAAQMIQEGATCNSTCTTIIKINYSCMFSRGGVHPSPPP